MFLCNWGMQPNPIPIENQRGAPHDRDLRTLRTGESLMKKWSGLWILLHNELSISTTKIPSMNDTSEVNKQSLYEIIIPALRHIERVAAIQCTCK